MATIDRNSAQPLYIQVKQHIIGEIESGRLRIGDKLMSENEMLKFYGVGRVTIRAALSELVSEGCLRKEQGLGTFVTAYPRQNKRLNIDVLLDNSDTYFTPYLLKGISQVLEQNHCNLLLHDTKCSGEHTERLLKDILRRGTDGVMMQAAFRPDQNEEIQELMTRYERVGIPIVVLASSFCHDYCINMSIDEVYGAEVAAQYLLECGHRHILGYFSFPKHGTSNQRRLQGFRNAMARVPDARCYELPEGMYGSEREYEKHILELVREKRITAIQCYNDKVAVDCLRLLTENGVRVPQDVSLIGFDDTDLSIHAIPRLTTMSHPKDHLGSAAANAVLRYIRNREEKLDSAIYRPGLVIRQSVRNLNED